MFFSISLLTESVAKAQHAPFGMPEVNFVTDFCELTQTDYVTAYSHELRMPLYATFTLEKKTVSVGFLSFCLKLKNKDTVSISGKLNGPHFFR